MKVLIIGIDHNYQAGNKNCSQHDIDSFKCIIESIISKSSVNGIFEEMNQEGLQKYGVNATISQSISNHNNINHMFIDPSISEREDEGIIERGLIKIRGINDGISNKEVEKKILTQDIKREKYWLSQLKSNAKGTVIFICGSDHVKRFYGLLQKNSIQSEILFYDWEPKQLK